MKTKIAFIILFSLSLLYGQKEKGTLQIPYDSLMDDRVSVDGYIDIEEQEYPASFRDPATGITVYWGYDDSLIYVGLEAKGKGWLAIGFGSPVMDGANMFIGYYTDDSAEVINHIGKGRTHSAAKGNVSLFDDWEIDYDEETNTTAMEFTYPLNWTGLKGAAINGLLPGETYDLILARNPKSPSLGAKHSQRSHYTFQMGAKPEKVVPAPDTTKKEGK
ncbi:MAG: DOMON domain-containing protein [candidate division WOR-3 bacterium]